MWLLSPSSSGSILITTWYPSASYFSLHCNLSRIVYGSSSPLFVSIHSPLAIYRRKVQMNTRIPVGVHRLHLYHLQCVVLVNLSSSDALVPPNNTSAALFILSWIYAAEVMLRVAIC